MLAVVPNDLQSQWLNIIKFYLLPTSQSGMGWVAFLGRRWGLPPGKDAGF